MMIKLDKNYYPMYLWQRDFLEGLTDNSKPFILAIERGEGAVARYSTRLGADYEKNLEYAERLVKFMLWSYGGYRFYVYGDKAVCDGLRAIYSPSGERAFDYNFMTDVYERALEFVAVENVEDVPADCDHGIKASAENTGYRIGFDAGGSDRKVTACIDGKVVFEKEVVWFPKLNSDPEYHKAGIKHSIDLALDALGGRVDAIGVSTAGIVVDGEMRTASLFRLVPKEIYKKEIGPIYLNLAKDYNCPVKVANDGDVASLAGAYSAGQGRVLGIAMGTSLAAGYVDKDNKILGYLNELAFVPVDANRNSAIDEWSGDTGVGVMYHSQDAVIKLAPEAGIELDANLSPAEKLKIVQKLANEEDERALAIFEKMGEYFGYTLLWFNEFYDIEKSIFLGRVASGKGGEVLLEKANSILKKERSNIEIMLPDEMSRRLGQSFTATLL